ncbi:alcohol dehydrogenase, partial [Alcaligenes pakistanensis]
MKALSKTLILVLVGLGAAYGGSQLILSQRSIVSSSANTINLDDETLIKQGAYVSRTGDCVACHTVPGGQKYAGGLAMQTPLGAIYSTNITPDKETGIGSYSLDEFKTA